MMDALLILRVLAAFLVAGTWITIVTLIADRFGSKLGALLATMPSNIVVSMLFIGIGQGSLFASDAATAVPAGLAVDALFIFIYVLAVKKYGLKAFIPAIGTWAVLIYLLGSNNLATFVPGLAAFVVATVVLFVILEYYLKIPSRKANRITVGRNEIIMRAIFSGSVVAAVVIVAAVTNSVWGGLLATFPASWSSSLFLVTRSQGGKFAQGFGKVMLFSQWTIIIYAIAVMLAFPVYGPLVGTLLAYLSSAVFVTAFYPFVKKLS